LLRRLEQQGWERLHAEPLYSGPWHTHELWSLASVWSPSGVRAFLVIQGGYPDDEPQQVLLYRERPDPLRLAQERCLGSYWVGEGVFESVARGLSHWRHERALVAVRAADPEAAPEPVRWDESVWLRATEAENVLPFLRGKVSERKWRLFACACCRRLAHVLDDPHNAHAVEAMERYADGLAPKREMKKARKAAAMPWLDSYEPYEEAEKAARALGHYRLKGQVNPSCDLLREVIGNPFATFSVRPAWLRWNEGTVARMAAALSQERRFEGLPILGDALEDAGCTDEAMLRHCREPREHVYGCWVLDLLLGKA
jgi:hypothetical protein